MLTALTLLRAGSCLRVERPYPAPTPDAVMAAVLAQAKAVRSLRGEARMMHRSPRNQVKATVRMMAAYPDRLRFDLVSPFDTPLATLVCREGRFALVDAQQNRHYYGPASPCNLARLLHVQIPADEVLTILAGSTPLIDHDQRKLRWDDRTGVEELQLSGKRLKQTIRLDGTDRRWTLLSSEIRDRGGHVLLRISAGEYRRVGGSMVPQRLFLEQPEHDAAIELRFKQEEINIELPPAAFELPSAGGLPSQRVACP